MVRSEARAADEYIESLPEDRQRMVTAIRDTILSNLPSGFEEMVDFGMIAYVVPLERFPDTYNRRPLMYAALASQKRHVSVYLMGVYSDDENQQWFREQYEATGKRLDMGKSCVRFRKFEDVPLDLIGRAIARDTPDTFIARYHRTRSQSRNR